MVCCIIRLCFNWSIIEWFVLDQDKSTAAFLSTKENTVHIRGVWVKQIISPGWMQETNPPAWCTGKTQRDRVERVVGGGIRMGNTCKSMADSCQCMTKTTTIL